MATWEAGIRINSEVGDQKVQVQANTATGAKEAIYRIYGTDDIWNLREMSGTKDGMAPDGWDFVQGVGAVALLGCYYGVTKVAYPATKFVVTKAVVPATVATAKYTWKGMKYVATTTTPQVYKFTVNHLIPAAVELAQDIMAFITQVINKVMGKVDHRPATVPNQYRKEFL